MKLASALPRECFYVTNCYRGLWWPSLAQVISVTAGIWQGVLIFTPVDDLFLIKHPYLSCNFPSVTLIMATRQATLLTFSDTTMEIDAGYGRVAVGDATISCCELLFRERSSTLSIRAPIAELCLAGTTSSLVNLVFKLFVPPAF